MPSLEIQPDAAERPQRADAARNRAKVLGAAREVFADEGVGAEMASIAERAEVGMGTVYRHFPTKEALLAALASAHFERLAEIAEAAAAGGGTPWEAVEQLVWRSAKVTAADHGMCEILGEAAPRIAAMPVAVRLRKAAATVMAAAVADGSARPDARGSDITLMMCAFGKIAALERRREGPPGLSWRRYLTIMLDGLRAH